LFFTGTAVEVGPITMVDHRPVGAGALGPATLQIKELYEQATHGHLPAYQHWLDPVYSHTAVGL
jgi:branched-chain amino acid aminotransferase